MYSSIPEIIQRKRDGHALSTSEIQSFIDGVTNNSVSDAQIAAFSMAAFFRDFNTAERTALTLAMRDSGQVLSWESLELPGPILDKHSTGGVGDLVSFVLAPIVAACGGYVPMIAGRGLAHTGGTIDKLESIPGYDTMPSVARFQHVVKASGLAIAGQSADLAPADRRMYATRDVTATVEQYGLITASILSKKLAAGLDFLVMDIKVGNGAFMLEERTAKELATSICAVGNAAGVQTQALITDMNQPLASSAGNALEVAEAVAFLRGDIQSSRLLEVTKQIAITMLTQSSLAKDSTDAESQVHRALDSGQAAERFGQMIAEMGGPIDFMDRSDAYLTSAPLIRPVFPNERHFGKFATGVDTRELGLAVVDLGGGRTDIDQPIDHAVGCTDWFRTGNQAAGDRPLAVIHARDEGAWQRAASRIVSAYTWDDELVGNRYNSLIKSTV